MRTVTFSDEKVARLMNDTFVSTWINRNPKFHNCTMDEEQRIVSQSFECYSTKNFCTFFVTPEQQVLHYFSGYYNPAFFRKEVEFVQEIVKECVDEKTGCLKKDKLSKYRSMHKKHAAEHKESAKKIQATKAPSAGSPGWEEFKENQERWRNRHAYLLEGVKYLGNVHESLEKIASKGAPAKLADVIKGYMGGNEFTEE